VRERSELGRRAGWIKTLRQLLVGPMRGVYAEDGFFFGSMLKEEREKTHY
jgi:hypothetical protein